MQQVKIFKCVETEVTNLEREVNTWIKDSGATIMSITGNIAPQTTMQNSKTAGLTKSSFSSSDVILVILFEISTP